MAASAESQCENHYGSNVDFRLLETYDVELEEWVPINRELRHYGLDPVMILHPSQIHCNAEIVVLDHEVSKQTRQNLLTLMKDCERRQALVQDLILNNNQLKEDLRKQNATTERLETKAQDLKIMLESAQYNVKELEEEKLMTAVHLDDEEERLRNTKNAAVSRNKQLDRRSKLQEEEIERLKEKVERLNDEDEKRAYRQHQVFESLKKRSGRGVGSTDEKLLDIIDSYETQLHRLRKEVELHRTEGRPERGRPSPSSSREEMYEASPNYKALMMSYEKQLHTAKRTCKDLEDRNELLKLELDSRPMMKDFRALQQKCKKYEKVLTKHKISVGEENIGAKDYIKNNRKYSTLAEDIDYLPLDQCRKHLKKIADQTQVDDLIDIVGKLDKDEKSLVAQTRLEQFARDVLDIVNSDQAPDTPNDIPPPAKKTHAVWCEKTWAHVIPTLDYWLQELSSVKELKQSVKRLSSHISPWRQMKFSNEPDIVQLISVIDSLAGDELKLDQAPEGTANAVLGGIVQHFQNLFDVPKISGVFPRMNEVYTKLGEVHNILNTLRNLLGLEPDAKASAIVDAVGRLCQSHNSTAARQLKQLLQEDDLDAVLAKLDLHDEFFPVFEEIMNRLMEVLEVSRIDQIIPAVRALQLLTC
ncbi:centrosomal protein of 70 kDa-like [Lineus longissimus]|uniref:centrosomal protein of 70 kDa-like n=1 Tax=Lineus longissimus TaxID=88925 RepID=UPI00315CA449